MRISCAILGVVSAAFLCPTPSSARPGPEIQPSGTRRVTSMDADTGRDLMKYPRSPVVDFQPMAVKLELADMNKPRMEAVQNLTLAPVGKPLSSLTLDAHLFEVKSVAAARPAQERVTYKHDGHKLTLSFDPPVPVG